jgi:beta-lactamase class A
MAIDWNLILLLYFNPYTMKNILHKSIPLPYFLIAISIVGIFGVFITNQYDDFQNKKEIENLVSNSSSCNYSIKRLKGYEFVKPLLFVDNACESEVLWPIKQRVTEIIDANKLTNDLISASFFFKDFNSNDWTSLNDEEKYFPGSLLKVPELIAFLKMNEINPDLLNKEILFDHQFQTDKKPVFLSKSIVLGQRYTIRQLLDYMITYSDNNATMLLNNAIDVRIFQKVFTDLGLEAPNWNGGNYPITAKDFSLFMRALYNGAYLNNKDSEFAIELLSKCNFKEGILKGLPNGTKVAHKFGESGDAVEKQLHESAIVYLNGKIYLITIMTKGKDNKKLADIISQISNVVFQKVNSMS